MVPVSAPRAGPAEQQLARLGPLTVMRSSLLGLRALVGVAVLGRRCCSRACWAFGFACAERSAICRPYALAVSQRRRSAWRTSGCARAPFPAAPASTTRNSKRLLRRSTSGGRQFDVEQRAVRHRKRCRGRRTNRRRARGVLGPCRPPARPALERGDAVRFMKRERLAAAVDHLAWIDDRQLAAPAVATLLTGRRDAAHARCAPHRSARHRNPGETRRPALRSRKGTWRTARARATPRCAAAALRSGTRGRPSTPQSGGWSSDRAGLGFPEPSPRRRSRTPCRLAPRTHAVARRRARAAERPSSTPARH